jgi:hypothetical protein
MVEGTIIRNDGTSEPITAQSLLMPLERALKTLCWSGVALALALGYLQYRS